MDVLNDYRMIGIMKLTLAFNELVRIDDEYLKNPSKELLEKSINVACYVQDGLQKYDITLQQLADIAGYSPKGRVE